MFYYCQKVENLKLPEFSTANKQIDYMFCDCNVLPNLDSITFDLSTTTSARSLFNRCYALSDVHFNPVDGPNLNNMYYMFNGCQTMENIDLTGLIGEAVTTIGYAFSDTPNLKTLNLDNFVGTAVTEGIYAFQGCGVENISLPNMTSQLTTMNYMFNDCKNLKEIHIPKLNTSAVTNMQYLFANCPNLETVEIGEDFNTSNVTSFQNMFMYSPKVQFPLERIDTSNATNLEGMFNGHPLTQEDLDIIKTWDTSKVTDMSHMFYNCNLPEEFSLAGFDMDEVTDAASMFAGNPNIKYINVDGVYAPKLGWSFLTGILTTSTEKLDFSNNETPMAYSYVYGNRWNGYTPYQGYTNLKELLIPNATWSLFLGTGKMFPDSPLEKISLGTFEPK